LTTRIIMENPGLEHELTLVSEILAVIERYNGDHGITPCPCELRDTMLTVAGLLHSEAERFNKSEHQQPLEDSFVERASICMARLQWASSNEASGFLQ
jgi:hypothetical protein